MGYIFLLISVLAGGLKGLFGKQISDNVDTLKESLAVNTVRCICCVIISFFIIFFSAGKIACDFNGLIFGSLSGFSLSVFLITWLFAVKSGAFMLVSVALLLSSVMTLVLDIVVFCTAVSVRQILGVIILAVAVLIMVSYNNTQKPRINFETVILLLLCAVSNGVYEFSQKLFTSFSHSAVSILNLITYTFGAIILFLAAILSNKRKSSVKKVLKNNYLSVAFTSICTFANSYFIAKATLLLSVAQVFLVGQALSMILSALIAVKFLGEKITPRAVIGISLGLLAAILIN